MDYVKYLKKAGVPEKHHEAAIKSLKNSKELSKKSAPYKWKAPFVIAKVVQDLPWEAEALPEKYWHYDNEVSINGDKRPWVLNDKGVGVPMPCPLDDSGIQYCYYAEGHHPRSKWARWVWLGLRNRASKYPYMLGPERSTNPDDFEIFGDIKTDKNHEGVVVFRMGEHWQIYSCEKLWKFVIRRNVGVKIKNVVQFQAERAMVVNIPFSMVAWKGE